MRPQMRNLTCAQTQPYPRVRPRTRTPLRPYVQGRAQHAAARPRTQCLLSVTAHASSLSESNALSLTRLATGNACGLNSTLLLVRGSTLSCARERSSGHTCAGAQHAPSRALSHERADTCVVVIRVECTVAYAAGHGRRTGPNRAFLHVRRRKRCRARGLERERSRGNTRSDARSTRSCTRCLTNVRTHTSSVSRSNAL